MMQYHIVNIVENMTNLIDFHGLLGVHSVIGDAHCTARVFTISSKTTDLK